MDDTKKIAELIQQQLHLGKSSDDIAEHLVANGAAVPIRCENCEHFLKSVDLCRRWESVTDSDGFCYCGVPRTTE